MLKTTIRRSGTSSVITIPPAILSLINAVDGDELQITPVDNNTKILLSKIEKEKKK